MTHNLRRQARKVLDEMEITEVALDQVLDEKNPNYAEAMLRVRGHFRYNGGGEFSTALKEGK